MKRLIFIFLLAGALSCQSENKKNANDRCESGTAAPALSAGNSREARILTTHFWVIEFYVGVNEATYNRSKTMKGKWYKFNQDGTFVGGHWEEIGCKGTWRLDYSQQDPIVWIDSYDDSEDCGWQIQGISGDESEMSWVGAKGYISYADMVKAINLMTIPTKKQFRVE